MSIALYPGTFDPFTLGHLDIVRRATRLFPNLTVAIAEGGRQTLFDTAERIKLARVALAEDGLEERVRIIEFKGLLIDCLRDQGANVVIRGIRTIGDFEHDQGMEAMHRMLHGFMQIMLAEGRKA